MKVDLDLRLAWTSTSPEVHMVHGAGAERARLPRFLLKRNRKLLEGKRSWQRRKLSAACGFFPSLWKSAERHP